MSPDPVSVFVVGGHGKVAIHFTKLAVTRGHMVYSLIRQPNHAADLPTSPSGTTVEPVVGSLEKSSVSDLAGLFTKYNPSVIFFSAGAGGKGGHERTTAVDQEGAIKVFDAIEQSGIAKSDSFRRFILLSSIDVRDTNKPPPSWYRKTDLEHSANMRKSIGFYLQAKYTAEKNLSGRTSFPWTVVRPGSLLDQDAVGSITLGQHARIDVPITRQDVAATVLAFAELPKGQADGLTLNLITGSTDIATSVKEAAERGSTDFEG